MARSCPAPLTAYRTWVAYGELSDACAPRGRCPARTRRRAACPPPRIDRCGRDDELVDLARRQRPAGSRRRHRRRRRRRRRRARAPSASAASKPATNKKPALGSGWSSVRWVSTNNGPGNGLVPPQAPAASYMPRPTIPDARPSVSAVVELLVRRRASVGVVAVVGVGPRATHHPVVQALAPDAEAVLRPVVRSDDVAVDRGRDGCDDLAHGSSFIRVRQVRPSRTPRIIGSAHDSPGDARTEAAGRPAPVS